MKATKIFRQCIRGCGNLPHVGEHPGTMMFFGFIAMGAIAGAKGGFVGALFGAFAMFAGLGWIYFWGAYERANDSDRMEKDAKK